MATVLKTAHTWLSLPRSHWRRTETRSLDLTNKMPTAETLHVEYAVIARSVRAAAQPLRERGRNRKAMFLAGFIALHSFLWAATTGSISGTVKDPSGAVIPGARVIVTNTAMGIQNKATTDDRGDYTFPSLPVGHYELQV